MSSEENSPLISSGSGGTDPHYVNFSATESDYYADISTGKVHSEEIHDPQVIKQYEEGQRSRDFIDPIYLAWEQINVYVDVERKGWFGGKKGENEIQQKQILRNVTGLVKPGTLLAIIGSSGAGKSTLINVLTGRNTAKYSLQGCIKVNGVELGREIANISAYCQQDEMFFGTLTVREHLYFRAMLRMDKSLSKGARLQRVEEVIVELGLSKCASTPIGVPGVTKSISGGEMKRLSFASEVLTNPPLMFCDEATSGLDSFMAQNVVQTLQNMASKGRTILCTIHQPSSEVFAMFDEVLILSEGRTAFMGPSREANKFFGNQGYPCPQNFNPADFYILLLAIAPGREPECREKAEKLCDAFSDSDTFHQLELNIKDTAVYKMLSNSTVKFEDTFGQDRYEISWMKQFTVVFWRSWVNLIRDKVLFRVRVMQTMVISVILGLVYLNQEYDETGVMNISGAIFLLIVNASASSIFAVIHSFPVEMHIFLREHGSGLYRVDVYFLAKTLAELPTFVFIPFLFVAIVYWMIGLYNDPITFLICGGVIVLVANVSVSFGYLLSTVSGSVDIALAIGPPLMIPLMLFGGLFLNNGSVADYFLWLKYLSWFQYANEVLSVNQWENVKELKCDVVNTTIPSQESQRCYKDGTEVLDSLNFSADNVPLDLYLLAALLVGYRLMSFLVLLYKAKKSKS